MPFRVHAGRQVIEDLGTEFNVNAYGDESVITTTLVQGSVRVDRQMLQPGQQAIQEATGQCDGERGRCGSCDSLEERHLFVPQRDSAGSAAGAIALVRCGRGIRRTGHQKSIQRGDRLHPDLIAAPTHTDPFRYTLPHRRRQQINHPIR